MLYVMIITISVYNNRQMIHMHKKGRKGIIKLQCSTEISVYMMV